jgi:hypothetical protein
MVKKKKKTRTETRASANQAASEKVVATVTTFFPEGRTPSLYKRTIEYICQQVVLEHLQETATKLGLEKVTNTVGTFLTDYKQTKYILGIALNMNLNTVLLVD